MRKIAPYLLCLFLGAAGMLLGLALTRDIGWSDYQMAAARITGPMFELHGQESGPLDEILCKALKNRANLSLIELFGIIRALNDAPTGQIDQSELRKSWKEIGIMGRVRIALFGMSRADYLAINAAIKSDPRINQARSRFKLAIKSCLPPSQILLRGPKSSW